LEYVYLGSAPKWAIIQKKVQHFLLLAHPAALFMALYSRGLSLFEPKAKAGPCKGFYGYSGLGTCDSPSRCSVRVWILKYLRKSGPWGTQMCISCRCCLKRKPCVTAKHLETLVLSNMTVDVLITHGNLCLFT